MRTKETSREMKTTQSQMLLADIKDRERQIEEWDEACGKGNPTSIRIAGILRNLKLQERMIGSGDIILPLDIEYNKAINVADELARLYPDLFPDHELKSIIIRTLA